jgi:phosphogluconate dehydratase
MSSGLSNEAKAKVREQAAQGLVGRAELLAAEQAAYHGEGTCTFYGTANSNQMLLEAMGLHVPGPPSSTRAAARSLTREAVGTVLAQATRGDCIGHQVDARCIVNAMVAAGHRGLDQPPDPLGGGPRGGPSDRLERLLRALGVVPLLARVYPNGAADVNQFQAAGGPAFVIRELLQAGLMHPDVRTVVGDGLAAYATVPGWAQAQVVRAPVAAESGDAQVLRPASDRSRPPGLQLLTGNLGRAVIKVSAVPADRHVIEAPARVFDSQEALQAAFRPAN